MASMGVIIESRSAADAEAAELVAVEIPEIAETTALGAAHLAGLTMGFWESQDEVAAHWRVGRRYEPQMSPHEADGLYARWQRATERSKNWEPKG